MYQVHKIPPKWGVNANGMCTTHPSGTYPDMLFPRSTLVSKILCCGLGVSKTTTPAPGDIWVDNNIGTISVADYFTDGLDYDLPVLLSSSNEEC